MDSREVLDTGLASMMGGPRVTIGPDEKDDDDDDEDDDDMRMMKMTTMMMMTMKMMRRMTMIITEGRQVVAAGPSLR